MFKLQGTDSFGSPITWYVVYQDIGHPQNDTRSIGTQVGRQKRDQSLLVHGVRGMPSIIDT